MKPIIEIKGLKIHTKSVNEEDYISLTDIAKQSERRPRDVIRDWIRNAQTIDFLEEWEKLHNPSFKGGQMHPFREMARSNRKLVSPKKFIEITDAIGLKTIAGRYGGGTFAHRDIALQFCNWFEPTFYVYMIKAFQQLIEERYNAQSLKWHIKRITDNIEDVRNLLDTVPGQDPNRNRIKS